MDRPHRRNSDIHDNKYGHQHPTLPMPPGYTPPFMNLTNNRDISDSDSPELAPAAISKAYHASGSQSRQGHSQYLGGGPYQNRERSDQISNEWGCYPSDTSSYTSSRSSSSKSYTHLPPFQDAYMHPASRPHSLDEDPHSDQDNTIITLRREKEHLEDKISKLEVKVASLEGELSSSRQSYEQLLEKITSVQIGTSKAQSHSTTAMDPFMSLLKDAREKDEAPYATHDQFPHIVYWTKVDYLKDSQIGREYLKTKRDDNSGSVGFLEDENGKIISREDQQRIRDYQRSLCYTLLKFGLAPVTWSRCTQVAREFFFRSMRTKFPVLRYCADHWKADTFMGLYY
ncbi:hypothetical protein PAXINDRAFT_183088, partial [Paxillus involutus ATCC 200175]